MARVRIAAAAAALLVTGIALAAGAPRPAALGQAMPGMWEIAGLPGSKAPGRECVGDLTALAQYEHRAARGCTRTILTDTPSIAVVDYSCAGGGFGRSKLTVITPRSLRIETQGISGGMPFNYVLQARRVGDCQVKATASAH